MAAATPEAPVSAPAPESKTHQPYVPASKSLAELTIKAVVLGAILGVVFAASSVYLALKVGLTVSASIPIAVLSITIFRAFGRATILENNIVQTAGSAGESIAAGVAFTLPSLLLMGYELEFKKVLVISLLGGLLGVLMMIPLRNGLIVEEHGKLKYPEGTACADVLVVGETGGTNAKTVLGGFGLGFLYKVLSDPLKIFNAEPGTKIAGFTGASVGGELTPELLGVGYIIGPKTSCEMMAGGILAYLVLIPMVAFFGEHLKEPIFPASALISAMEPGNIRSNYVLYIGAGAVATGGFVSLARAIPTIAKAFRAGIKNFSAKKTEGEAPRTMQDLPFNVVVYGSLGLLALMWLAPNLHIHFLAAILILIFGFFFVTVSSRITGEIGSSSNPISGMTVATLLITCLIFLAIGWVGPQYRAMALTTAAIVCIAASNGGTTSQDLKTGFLVGATPRKQQIALLVGVVTSAVFIGWTLLLLNKAYTTTAAETYGRALAAEQVTTETAQGPDGKPYKIAFQSESGSDIPQGKYLVDDAGKIAFVLDPGIGGRVPYGAEPVGGLIDVPAGATKLGKQLGPDRNEYDVIELKESAGDLLPGKYLAAGRVAYHLKEVKKLVAPKASLFALIIDGILTRKLPWTLVLVGVMLAVVMELCGVASLPFAVGVYLPLSTSVPIFVGGVLRWLVDARKKKSEGEEEFSAGTLLSSGYIAGGTIAGLVAAIVAGLELESKFDLGARIGEVARSNWSGIVAFAALAFVLYRVATRGESAVVAPAGAEPPASSGS